MEYQSLSDSLTSARNVFASVTQNDIIYFLGETNLFKVVGTVASVVLAASPEDGTFTGMYVVGKDLYINTENEGIKKLSDNLLTTPSFLVGEDFVFSEPSPEAKAHFIATENNKFFPLP